MYARALLNLRTLFEKGSVESTLFAKGSVESIHKVPNRPLTTKYHSTSEKGTMGQLRTTHDGPTPTRIRLDGDLLVVVVGCLIQL